MSGAVLPGVTVTATSPALLRPVTAVTDSTGYYRLLNLPPGTYALSAELQGFATVRREGLIMRAGLTLTVDVDLKIGTLAETVTVSGDSDRDEPADERDQHRRRVASRGADHVAASLQRRARSRPGDRLAQRGRRRRAAAVSRGSHIYAHAFQLEGAPASAYIDSAAHSMGMGGDTVQDVEIKLGGADASTPSAPAS